MKRIEWKKEEKNKNEQRSQKEHLLFIHSN